MKTIFASASGATNQQTAVTSKTISSFTVNSGDEILIVCAGIRTAGTAPTAMNCTWNGVALSEIADQSALSSSRIYLGYLLHPASGNHNLVFGNWTTAAVGSFNYTTYNNVDLINPVFDSFVGNNSSAVTPHTIPLDSIEGGMMRGHCHMNTTGGYTVISPSIARGDNTSTNGTISCSNIGIEYSVLGSKIATIGATPDTARGFTRAGISLRPATESNFFMILSSFR